MANRFWVGGSATWDATAGSKWAQFSGGAGGFSAPISSDNVFFDANSGAVTVTSSGNQAARSIDFSGFTGTFIHGASSQIDIGDNVAGTGNIALKMAAGMTYTVNNPTTSVFKFVSSVTTVQTITSAGKVFGSMTFTGGTSAKWQLADALSVSNATTSVLLLTAGQLDTNGMAVTAAIFRTTGSSTRALVLGATVFTVTSTSTPWDIQSNTSFTFTPNTSTISMGAGIFNSAGLTYYALAISGNATLGGTNTFTNITITNGAVSSIVSIGANQTISGTFSATSTSATSRIMILGTGAVPWILTAAAVSLTNTDFVNITGAGAATWSGTGLGDGGANTNITFATPRTIYMVSGAGVKVWSNASIWSLSSGGSTGEANPRIQDTVRIDGGSGLDGSSSINFDIVRIAKNVDFTGAPSGLTLIIGQSISTNTPGSYGHIYGSLTMGTGMQVQSTGNALAFGGAGSVVLTTNGVTMQNININKISGATTTLGSDLTIDTASRTLSLFGGNFNAAGYNVTCFSFTSAGNVNGTMTAGTGTWTAAGTGSVVAMSNGTWDWTGGTLVISNTSATSKSISFATTVFPNNITITGDNVIIPQGIIRGNLALNNGGLSNGTKFTSSVRFRVLGEITTNGSAGSLAVIQSNASGVAALFEKGQGVVRLDYVSIKDITARGGAAFAAGSHSTNVSGNVGWAFRDGASQSASGVGMAFMGLG
jgi:hypothetical protein